MISNLKCLLIFIPLLAVISCRQNNKLTINYPPPSYLTELVSPVSEKKTLFEVQKEYGNNVTVFRFTTKFNSLIQTWLEADQHYGGTIWGIDTTGNKILLFDQFRHGYDAIMKLNKEDDLKSTKSINFSRPTEIIIAFQYSGDESEYVNDGTSKYKQDYFGWVAIYKMVDDRLEEILNYECA